MCGRKGTAASSVRWRTPEHPIITAQVYVAAGVAVADSYSRVRMLPLKSTPAQPSTGASARAQRLSHARGLCGEIGQSEIANTVSVPRSLV